MYNILTERLIRMDKSDGSRVEASLPEVYAALMADKVEAFPALRPHQRHAWHAFLVQLGAMAVHEAGLAEAPRDADEWRRIIRGLTLEWGDDEPWQLVVDDITRPAFMQPPASSKEREADFKITVETPDELDIISTSRNHDVKTGSLGAPKVDDWMFALINMQTMDGRPGNGYYGISRMNSNDGSRTAFSLTPSLRWGCHLIKDISSLLKTDFAKWPMHWEGVNLIWTEPWDGMKSEALTLEKLHPFYLEVCRRCRMKVGCKGLYAQKAPRVKGGGCRVGAEASRGNVGDPWTLITEDATGPKALTLQKDSFSYRNIAEYLFNPKWGLPALFDMAGSGKDQNAFLVARGLRRKKGGQTEGYYERVIPLRPRVAQVFGRGGDPGELSDLARQRVEQVGKVKDILHHAIATYAADGKSEFKAHRNGRPSPNQLAQPWANRLDAIVDAHFFEQLQEEFESDDREERKRIRNQWLLNGNDGVVDHADRILRAAEDALPCQSLQRFKASVTADGVFWRRLKGNSGLPFLYEIDVEKET